MGKRIQAIGKYSMCGNTLGKGNFARVELAVHEVTKCKVAIKIIDTRKITEDYVRNNLYREAKILSQLKHPNIMKFYESLKATTLYCLVAEYVSGGELLTYLKTFPESRLPEADSRPFVRQVVSALHYMHERGVVHRDLKMENILLDEKKRNIKIVDFGLSNYLCENCKLKTHCGSPEYAAPELFLPDAEYGSEIDIWSLGIIMYVMVVGKLPFSSPYHDHARRQRLLNQINRGLQAKHERDMEHLSSDCRQLIRQLIEPNPTLRFPLHEIENNCWFTNSGEYPFTPYNPPPRDPSLRSQSEASSVSNVSSVGTEEIVITELASLVDMSREEVERCVHEYSSNELSAMFNMLLEARRKEKGIYDEDHTCRRDELLRYEKAKLNAREKWRTLRKNLKESAKLFKEALKERETHQAQQQQSLTPGSLNSPQSQPLPHESRHSPPHLHSHPQPPSGQHPLLKLPEGSSERTLRRRGSRYDVGPPDGAPGERCGCPAQTANHAAEAHGAPADTNGNSRRPTSLDLNRQSASGASTKSTKKKKKKVLNPLGFYVPPKPISLFPPKRTPFNATTPSSPTQSASHSHCCRRPSFRRPYPPAPESGSSEARGSPKHAASTHQQQTAPPTPQLLPRGDLAAASGAPLSTPSLSDPANRAAAAPPSTDILGVSPTAAAEAAEAKAVAARLYREELLEQAQKRDLLTRPAGPAPRAMLEDLCTPVAQTPPDFVPLPAPHWPRSVDDASVIRRAASETSDGARTGDGSCLYTSSRTSAGGGQSRRDDSTRASSQFSASPSVPHSIKNANLKSASDTSVLLELNGSIPVLIASETRLVVPGRMK